MKRIVVCILLIAAILSDCGLMRSSSYVVVTPHNEDYGVALDSDVLTVSSYLSLKNALINAVEDRRDDFVIRAESYPGNLGEDLNQAVYEVSKMSPLGAYVVSSMTYDYSRIVSYYEINFNVSYKRSLEEIQQIVYVTDLSGIREKLEEAMASYEPRLILRVGDYRAFDLATEVESVFTAHPEFCIEMPETSMDLYPESGTQRILDIKFTYFHSPEELAAMRDEVETSVRRIVSVYGLSNSELTNARRIYERLGRNAGYIPQEDSRTASDGVYGALINGQANSYGFAQAYCLLMQSCGIPCTIVSGQKGGAAHSWCLMDVDGTSCYVDPSLAADGDHMWFLLGTMELELNGYEIQNPEEYPFVELPWALRPSP